MTKNAKITKYQARKATTTVRLRGRLQPEQFISTKFTANKSMKSCVFELENTDIVNNIRVTLTQNGKFIGNSSIKGPTKKVTVGMNSIFELVQGVEYEVNVYLEFGGTAFDLDCSVKFLEYESGLNDAINEILENTETGNNVSAVTYGISESAFSDLLMQSGTNSSRVDLPGTNLKAEITLGLFRGSERYFPVAEFDEADNNIKISILGSLRLFNESRTGLDQLSFTSTGVFSIKCRPVLVTGSNDNLKLELIEFSYIQDTFDAEIEYKQDILDNFPSVDDFLQQMEEEFEKAGNSQGSFAAAIPTYVNMVELPEFWGNLGSHRVDFQSFKIKDVDVHGYSVGYLFMTFGIQSLGIPPQCYCDQSFKDLINKNFKKVNHNSFATSSNIAQYFERDYDHILSELLAFCGFTL